MRRPKQKTVKLEEVVIDQRAQTRADGLDAAHVEQMVEDLKSLPPMLVVEVDGRYLLADGFHRHAAYKKAKMIRVPVAVIVGTEDDWIDAFASANDGQKGKPRTREDKRNSVRRCLELRPKWSNVRIAESAKVSEFLVRQLRKDEPQEEPSGSINRTGDKQESEQKRVGKDGVEQPASKKKPTKTSEKEPQLTASEQPAAADPAPVPPPPTPAPEQVNQVSQEPAGDPEQPATIDAGAVFVDEVVAVCRDMDRVNARMRELKAKPYAYTIHFDSAIAQVDAARKTLWVGRPAFACPYCEREGGVRPACNACKGTGRVKKTTFDSGKEAVQ